MSLNFKFLIHIFIIALMAKALSLVLYFYLPHYGVNKVEDFSINLYKRYLVSKAFNLKSHKKDIAKKPKQPIYRLTNVKLKAIYSSSDKGVIAIEDGKKLIFLSTGENFKGYKLIEVKPNRAIFEKNGKHFELKLEEKALKGKILESNSFNPDEVKFAVLKRDIQKYKKNFNEIWRNIAIKELIDKKNKKLKGFEVTWVNKNSIFGKMGLRKGDIIIGANNKIFHSYSDVIKIYNNIDKYNALKLTILRNNQKKELEYEIY